LGAIRRAKAETSINQANDLTIFAPNNQAFNAIGSLVAGLTADELTTVLGYHVIRGKVLYSEQIVDDINNAASGSTSGTGSVAGLSGSGSGVASQATSQGGNVYFRIENGRLFINSACVIQADLLVANGIVHIIDG